MKVTPRHAICVVVFAFMLSSSAVNLSAQETYSYDFADGAQGWDLDDNWSLTDWDPGGQALLESSRRNRPAHRGHRDGPEGVVSYSRWTGPSPFFCVRFGGPGGPTGLEYSVCLEANGVGITSRQNEATQELAFVPFSIEGGLTHSATLFTGDGSLDVFIDDVGVVGIDASDPAAGSVLFLAGPKSVIIDDVGIVLGGDGSGHDRAPRPVDDIEPGPDVGPFVDGKVSGGFTLSGDEHLELTGGRYIVTDGGIFITENATLTVADGGVLAFGLEGSPLLHFGVHVSGDGTFRVDGGRVVPFGHGPLIVASSGEQGTIEIHDSAPWFHIIQAEGSSTVLLDNIRLVTAVGGQIAVGGNADVTVSHSVLSSIAFDVPAGGSLHAEDLGWDRYLEDFDLGRDLDIDGIDYDLSLQDVALYPSAMIDGANEKGWIISVDGSSTLDLNNSEIGKLNFDLAAGDGRFLGERVEDRRTRGLLATTEHHFRRGYGDPTVGLLHLRHPASDLRRQRGRMAVPVRRGRSDSQANGDERVRPPRLHRNRDLRRRAMGSAACEIIDDNDFTVRGSVITTACPSPLFVVRVVHEPSLRDPSSGCGRRSGRRRGIDGDTRRPVDDGDDRRSRYRLLHLHLRRRGSVCGLDDHGSRRGRGVGRRLRLESR